MIGHDLAILGERLLLAFYIYWSPINCFLIFKPKICLAFLENYRVLFLTSILLNNCSVINARGSERMFYLDNLGRYLLK